MVYRMLVGKKFTFDASHKLPKHEGKCSRLHGHTYTLWIYLIGNPISKTGMVMDYYKISEIVKSKIIDQLDHNYLNDTIEDPTAERICFWIWNNLIQDLPNLFEVQVMETPDNVAKFRGMDDALTKKIEEAKEVQKKLTEEIKDIESGKSKASEVKEDVNNEGK